MLCNIHTHIIYIYNSTPGSKTQNSKQLPATWCQCPRASLRHNLLEIGCDQALPHTHIAEAPSPVRSHGHHRRWSRASSCARLLGPSFEKYRTARHIELTCKQAFLTKKNLIAQPKPQGLFRLNGSTFNSKCISSGYARKHRQVKQCASLLVCLADK